MDLKIEENWLSDVWEFYLDVMKKREARANVWHQDNKTNSSTAIFEVEPSSNAIEKATEFLKEDKKLKTKKIYVRELTLGFMKVNLSYFKSSKTKSSWGNSEPSEETLVDVDHLESSGADAYRQWSENMTDRDVDERLQYVNIISAVFPSISEAPIRFQQRVIEHVYGSEGDIF